jgi:hypothetical protein
MSAIIESPAVLPHFVTNEVSRGVVMCCPVCGCRNIHPAEVIVSQQRSRTKVMKEFTCVTRSDRHHKQTGVEITLDFWCEAGHAFEYSLDFRKDRIHVGLETETVDPSEPRDEF